MTNQYNTKGHGYFRKTKAYGLVCGIALAGILMLSQGVSADEVTAPQTKPTTEVVAPAANQVSASAETPAKGQSAVTSDIPTSVPAHTTQDQAVTAVEDAQAILKDNVSTAKDTGVVVKEGDTQEVVINSGNAAEKTSEVLTDLNQQDKAVKEATEKQRDNVKAYEETKAEHETVVKEGQDSLDQSTAEVDKLMEQAKKAGLLVTETITDKTPDYKDTKGLTGDELRQAMAGNLKLYKEAIAAGLAIQGKSVEELKQALALYQANQKAYTETKTSRDLAVSEGQSTLKKAEAALDEQLAIAKKYELTVTTATSDKTPSYKNLKGLTGNALRAAMAENLELYTAAVKAAADAMNLSTSDMKKQIDAYAAALADYQKGIGTNTGLKWRNGVILEAGPGATKMTGAENVVNFADGSLKAAAMYATQGNNLDQNTDANFENIFKIDGTGTILVKNTTNGDVTLTFSEINSPYNTGTYVAIWGDDNGGIAWSVFALYSGAAQGGAGESASGSGSGIGGRILNYVYAYKVQAVTSNDVSVVTFNDIDNKQTIEVSGLDGASIEKGKNVTGSGTRYSSGAGDKSQASAGVLDSNGVGWTFDTAKKQDFTVVHSVDGKNTSIVGGIFGVASEKPKEPKKPELTATKATVTAPEAPEAPKPISVAVQKATVTAPDAPEAPVPTEVSVHYYKMTTTPEEPTSTPHTPVQKASVLPSTGEAGSVLSVVGGVLLSGLGLVGVRKRKED